MARPASTVFADLLLRFPPGASKTTLPLARKVATRLIPRPSKASINVLVFHPSTLAEVDPAQKCDIAGHRSAPYATTPPYWRRGARLQPTCPPTCRSPEDDGAADHLEGLEIPAGWRSLRPRATRSTSPGRGDAGSLVAYVYPRTGVPGEPLIDGWDDIPGARGCTPQSCAYRDSLAEFGGLGATVVGISAQSATEQAEFADREHIPFPLLADPGLRARRARSGCRPSRSRGLTLYRRLTLVIRGRARVEKAFYPVFPPDRNAAEVLGWLRDR